MYLYLLVFALFIAFRIINPRRACVEIPSIVLKTTLQILSVNYACKNLLCIVNNIYLHLSSRHSNIFLSFH